MRALTAACKKIDDSHRHRSRSGQILGGNSLSSKCKENPQQEALQGQDVIYSSNEELTLLPLTAMVYCCYRGRFNILWTRYLRCARSSVT